MPTKVLKAEGCSWKWPWMEQTKGITSKAEVTEGKTLKPVGSLRTFKKETVK